MNNRVEPTKEENEQAIRDHDSKPKTFDFEMRDARAGFIKADYNDTGCDLYRVVAYDERFGDNLIVAEFAYDDTHEGTFYRDRARFMAEMLANIINR